MTCQAATLHHSSVVPLGHQFIPGKAATVALCEHSYQTSLPAAPLGHGSTSPIRQAHRSVVFMRASRATCQTGVQAVDFLQRSRCIPSPINIKQHNPLSEFVVIITSPMLTFATIRNVAIAPFATMTC
jgi:hypothetical protein